jgi:hypothetical protein
MPPSRGYLPRTVRLYFDLKPFEGRRALEQGCRTRYEQAHLRWQDLPALPCWVRPLNESRWAIRNRRY